MFFYLLNFSLFYLVGNSLGIPIILRTPVVPNIEQGIEQISNFAKDLKNIYKYELLPYHPLGETKRQALGLKQSDFREPTSQEMKELEQYAFIR